MVGPEEGLEVGLLDVEGIMVGDMEGLAVGLLDVEGIMVGLDEGVTVGESVAFCATPKRGKQARTAQTNFMVELLLCQVMA